MVSLQAKVEYVAITRKRLMSTERTTLYITARLVKLSGLYITIGATL
jgi:hypothetical protein